MLSGLVLRLARHPASGALVGWAFAHLHALLPLRRVASTKGVLAFHHPRPSWPTHVLLVPKRQVRSLVTLAHPQNVALFAEILRVADAVVQTLGLIRSDLVLCANGGPRQEVGQVHFHLFAGEQYVSAPDLPPQKILHLHDDVAAYRHPTPDWETHMVVSNGPAPDPAMLLQTAAQLVTQFALDQRGYTLVVADGGRSFADSNTVHLISGRRL